MTATSCSREPQVVQAVLSGTWPEGCERDLTAHAAHCEVCSEVAAVATALRTDYDESRREAHVPAAGQVWWRAAVRARLETTVASTQPITWLHGVTGAITIGLMLAAIGIAWPSIAIAAEWGKALLVAWAPQLDTAGIVVGALRQSFVIALIAGACLVLAPVALYFALSDD